MPRKMVDELSLLIVPKAKVIRDGREQSIPVEDVVLDDVLVLDSGQQICCDSVVIEGESEVNESLLTGESDPVNKMEGDPLLSGASIVSGRCLARVVHVGEDNYVSRVTAEIRSGKGVAFAAAGRDAQGHQGDDGHDHPAGHHPVLGGAAAAGRSAYMTRWSAARPACWACCPKGLVLLISVSLAAGTTKLARKKVLVQNLYSLESLAYVDTLCLDKTGTVTTGKMQVERIIPLGHYDAVDLEHWSAYLYHSDDNNETYQALCRYAEPADLHAPDAKIAFSSARKWGAWRLRAMARLCWARRIG